jgi:hypothetical protein
MTNKILFTQDLPGERLWLQKHFPSHLNLETRFSGNWSSAEPVTGDNNFIFEYSFSDFEESTDFFKFCLPKYKSIFSNRSDHLFSGKAWAVSDSFVHDLKFENIRKSNNFIILNLARSGTLFLRSLLIKKLIEFQDHISVKSNTENLKIKDIILDNKLTTFFCYRTNIWEWITSNVLSINFGYHHYDTRDLDKIYILMKLQMSTWNFWCNLKCAIPDLNCYLLEFEYMISKYSEHTDHTKISYNKKDLIENYQEMHDLYQKKYQSIFEKIVNNGVNHLTAMNCKKDILDLEIL